MINSAIFRAYDIRGNSPIDLNYENAYKIGFCFAKMVLQEENNKICVGRDGRLSSPELYRGIVGGITHAGAEVISVGLVPTPLLYFADQKFKPAASIMITGSHNPKDDNGFKMIANGKSFFDQQIQELMRAVQIVDVSITCHILPSEIDLNHEYVQKIIKGLTINPKLKVAWDPANGAGSKITKILKEILPNKNFSINSEIDGNFPNHHPDPSVPKNLEQLISLAKKQNCDFGIAFDGDADRVGIVSGSGKIVTSDQLLCFFAKDILANNPGATIIADVKTSNILFNEVENYGGVPLMWKTGHSWIKNKMVETKAILAGEMSGHIFFRDNGYDDGIYAALRFIDLMSRSSDNLDKMISSLPILFNTAELKIKAKDEEKFIIIEQIKQQLKEQKIDFTNIDGVRVSNENGWWLLRASNTGAYLIARAESKSENGLNILLNNLTKLIESYDLKFESGDH